MEEKKVFRGSCFVFRVFFAQNPKPETRNTKPETRNPKPETRNTKPETRNPKPETRNTLQGYDFDGKRLLPEKNI